MTRMGFSQPKTPSLARKTDGIITVFYPFVTMKYGTPLALKPVAQGGL